ncbi:MAG TPA: uroporphyrinogen-III synthase [Pyrinomonadaceae bacterium]|nr:uroporphyrinogen-III synthase [Pyrinomonadaceae bacterium]
MASDLSNQTLSGRTVLVSPHETRGKLAAQLTRHGARMLSWPILDVSEPEHSQALDEAIENLFGYDWIIFNNANAVNFFLLRFRTLRHEISELDSLRVCGVGEETVHRLEEAQVHIDVTPDRLSTRATVEAIEAYVGGRDRIRGLNVLVPGGSIARDCLQEALEDTGGRADLVASYRTSAANVLARVGALVAGGGIDCVAFTTASEVREFAGVFDTNDLDLVLAGVAVACPDEITAKAANEFSLTADIVAEDAEVLPRAIASYFHAD